jgi:hypothetical protein
MSIELISAIIAFIGVIVSVVFSLYISIKQTNAELQKLRAEIRQDYANKLLEKRVEIYPDLYARLSTFTKSVRSNRNVSKKMIKDVFEQVSEWDVKFAVFLSGNTNELLYRFRNKLSGLLSMAEADIRKEFDAPEAIGELIRAADEVKLALKTDLGIFVVEFPDKDKRYTSFKEISGDVIEK